MELTHSPVIDVHAHLLPERAWEVPTAHGIVAITEHPDGLHLGSVPIAVGRRALSDPEVMLADMDRAGLDIRVVSPPPYAFPVAATPPAAIEYCDLVTHEIVRACSADPERLIPFGIIPTNSAEIAAASIESVAAAGGRGVVTPPILDGQPLGESVGRQLLRSAAEAGLPVLVHPVQSAKPELGTHYLRNLIGNPYETSVAIASCALSGTLDELPELRILFVHAAGCAPMLLGRWDHGWRHRVDVGIPGVRAPSLVLRERIFLDALAHHPVAVQLAEESFGATSMTLGSDYPFDMADPDPVESARDAGLDPNRLSENARRWLGGALTANDSPVTRHPTKRTSTPTGTRGQ